jgi:hypothetical protein
MFPDTADQERGHNSCDSQDREEYCCLGVFSRKLSKRPQALQALPLKKVASPGGRSALPLPANACAAQLKQPFSVTNPAKLFTHHPQQLTELCYPNAPTQRIFWNRNDQRPNRASTAPTTRVLAK